MKSKLVIGLILLISYAKGQDSVHIAQKAGGAWYSKFNLAFGWSFKEYKEPQYYVPYDLLVDYYADASVLYKNAYHDKASILLEIGYAISSKINMAIGGTYVDEDASDNSDLGSYAFRNISFYWQGEYFILPKKIESAVQPFVGIRTYCGIKQIDDNPMGDNASGGFWTWYGHDLDQPTLLLMQIPVGITISYRHVRLGVQANVNMLGYVTGKAHATSYLHYLPTNTTTIQSDETIHYDKFLTLSNFITDKYVLPSVVVKAGFNF